MLPIKITASKMDGMRVRAKNCQSDVRSRRRYLRYRYHSIFVLHLMNDKDKIIAIAQMASS